MTDSSNQGGGPKKQKGKSKGKVLNLEELLGTNMNWADKDKDADSETHNVGGPTNLPSGPKASRGDVVIDINKLPAEGPFVVYMGNIAYGANDRVIQEFFNGLYILNIRTMTDNGRPKGFCYIEFGSRADLAEALKLNNELLLGRPVKIDLADQERNRNKPYEQQRNREGGDRQYNRDGGGDRQYNRDGGGDRQYNRDGGGDRQYNREGGDRQYNREGGDRQRYNNPGGGGQAEATSDWRAQSRTYESPSYGMARDRGPPPRSDESLRQNDTSAPKERPKLALQPRTVAAAPAKPSSAGIFGGAKPVDTSQVEDKAEKKILKLKEEMKK